VLPSVAADERAAVEGGAADSAYEPSNPRIRHIWALVPPTQDAYSKKSQLGGADVEVYVD